jgi:hypothetical protein
MDFNEALGSANLPDEVKATLTKPEVAEVLKGVLSKMTEPLAAKNAEVLNELKSLKSTIGEVGGTEALKQLKAAKEKDLQDRLNGNDVETVKKTYQSQLDAETKTRKNLEKRMVETEVSRLVSNEIAKADGVPELLEHVVRGRIRAELGDDLSVRVKVLDVNGTPKLNSDGREASITDIIEELKGNSVYGRAFKAANVSGSGAKSSAAPAAANNPFRKETFNLTEGGKLLQSNPALARSMLLEAGKNPVDYGV